MFGLSPENVEKISKVFWGFFVTIFFLFKIIYNREAYFMNYNLQTNVKKKSTIHFTCPSGYCKRTPFVYSPVLNLPPPTLTQKLNQIKCQKVKKSSTSCHFLLYISCLFSLFNEIFSSIFLNFVISRIKDFIFNDSDLLEL